MRKMYTTAALMGAVCFMAADAAGSATVNDNVLMVVLNAVKALDAKKDSDWTENGKPSLKRVRQLAKNDTITQEQLDAAAPDADRPKFPADYLEGRGEMYASAKNGNMPELQDPVSQVMMVATETGYASGSLQKPGDIFLFSGVPGSWMREATKEDIKAYDASRSQS